MAWSDSQGTPCPSLHLDCEQFMEYVFHMFVYVNYVTVKRAMHWPEASDLDLNAMD